MAMPIKPTPTLYGKDADNFLRMVEDGHAKPLKKTAAPCLDNARQLARRLFASDAEDRKKLY